MKNWRVPSIVAVVLITVPLAATAAVALFDGSHGQLTNMYGHPVFSQARSDLLAAGHILDATTAPITLDVLEGFDLYVSGTLQVSYTADEIAALQAFVAGGGTVLITHDGGGAADAHVGSVNAFLQPYGMVIVMGDESCWSDPGGGADYTIDDADNLALLLAIFDCVPGPVRTEDHSWSGVRALFE